MEHTLVKYEFQPNSFPIYRHYVECSCGFQARMASETAVKNQYNNHLQVNGLPPYFTAEADQIVLMDEQAMEAKQKAKNNWNPFASKK